MNATPSTRPASPEQRAGAYANTYWWAVGLSVLVPALLLPRRPLGIRAWLNAHHYALAGNEAAPDLLHQ